MLKKQRTLMWHGQYHFEHYLGGYSSSQAIGEGCDLIFPKTEKQCHVGIFEKIRDLKLRQIPTPTPIGSHIDHYVEPRRPVPNSVTTVSMAEDMFEFLSKHLSVPYT